MVWRSGVWSGLMREHEPARNFRREFVKQEHSDKNGNIGRDPSDSEWAETGICLTITSHHYHYRFTIVASKPSEQPT